MIRTLAEALGLLKNRVVRQHRALGLHSGRHGLKAICGVRTYRISNTEFHPDDTVDLL